MLSNYINFLEKEKIMYSVENVLHIKIKQSFKIEYLNYRFISIDYFDRLNYLCVSYKVSS